MSPIPNTSSIVTRPDLVAEIDAREAKIRKALADFRREDTEKRDNDPELLLKLRFTPEDWALWEAISANPPQV